MGGSEVLAVCGGGTVVAGFKVSPSDKARSVGYRVEQSPTLLGTQKDAAVMICLNDQGGAVMDVTYDKTQCLRSQMKHHEPIVLVDRRQSDELREYNDGITPTLSRRMGTGGVTCR